MAFPTVLDSTIVTAYKDCGMKFKYNYMLPIKPRGISIDLIAGDAFAQGLETARRCYLEQGMSVEDALAQGLVKLTQVYGEPIIPEKKRNKAWDRVVAGFVSYFDQWPIATDFLQVAKLNGKYAIEFTFALPLPIAHPDTGDPILYCGRCDWLCNQAGSDTIFCVDDKTTGQFRGSWAEDWQLRFQFFGYMYAAKAYGLNVGGTFVRGTCLQLTQIQHLQAIVTCEWWKLERWYHDLLKTVRLMIADYEANDFGYALSEPCTSFSGCPFQRLCQVRDPEPWIKIDYEHNPWTPLRAVPGAKIGEVELA